MVCERIHFDHGRRAWHVFAGGEPGGEKFLPVATNYEWLGHER